MAHGEMFSQGIAQSVDDKGSTMTAITCHGKLDSAALGELVALKVSAINKGYCKLELVNLSAPVKQLLTMTNLMQLFSQPS